MPRLFILRAHIFRAKKGTSFWKRYLFWVSKKVANCFIMKFAVPQWGSPYTDDNLGSKKYLPGYSFKGRAVPRKSPWVERGKVTKDSCLAMFTMIHSQHCKNPDRKLLKANLEEKAEICALACPLGSMFNVLGQCKLMMYLRPIPMVSGHCFLWPVQSSGALIQEVAAEVPNSEKELRDRFFALWINKSAPSSVL